MAKNYHKEKLILKQLKLGDIDAFTQIYTTYYAKLCRYVYKLSGNTDIAEDIVQEQLMQLWEKRQKLTINSLNSYLYKAVYNKYINYYNTQKKQISLKAQLQMEAIIEVEDTDASTNKERLNLLYKIINNLPKKRKEIFILSRLKNYQYKEIAKIKNISERTVETQIRKALITIRKEIAKSKLPLLYLLLSSFY
ncbi:RNA polymerase sigma factor [Cellulophaga fucicola]|uniref:RNA polymerase sigma factor n=1 Tax=Cellulophaga fucicola TaxID=76595 RepID=UPI003EBCE7EB